MSNLKLPPVFLRIPTTTQEIMSIRPQSIEYLEDSFFEEEKITIVTHLVGRGVHKFQTNLTTREIEQGMRVLQQQQEEYEDKYFQAKFLGGDE